MPTEKTQELLDQLAAGVAAIKTSDDWTDWLEVARRFYRYSFGNQLLIYRQLPTASHVAGFHKWLELGRHVRKGEHGLRILAPVVYKTKTEDPETGEEESSRRVAGFRGAVVFDVSQTDGDPLPEPPAHPLTGAGNPAILAALVRFAQDNGAEVDLDADLPDGRNGETSYSPRRIRISRNLSGQMQIKTMAHEIGHHLLHFGPDRAEIGRDIAELEAESIAYLACGMVGIDSAAYSFGYVATWTAGKDSAAAVQASGQRILKTARAITDALAA